MSQIIAKKSSRLNAKKQQKPQIFIDPQWQAGTIDLSIIHQQKIEQTPKVIKGFKIYRNHNGDIIGSYLCQAMKNANLVRDQSTLSFYNFEKKIYYYGFTLEKQSQITNNVKKSLIKDQTLYIKIRNKKKLVVDALIDQQRQKYQDVEQDKNNKQKQKKIGQVVEKVALWRKFYTGFYDQMGNYIQKPLQNAANQVGIAKKTLDDYLLQIRNGKKYGFNFNQKVNCKIGQLRAFVRDQKKKQTGK